MQVKHSHLKEGPRSVLPKGECGVSSFTGLVHHVGSHDEEHQEGSDEEASHEESVKEEGGVEPIRRFPQGGKARSLLQRFRPPQLERTPASNVPTVFRLAAFFSFLLGI